MVERVAEDASRGIGPPIVIAIDGPAGVGKSTVARGLADAIAWAHLDSGAMYRAVSAAALEAGVALDDEARLARLAADLDLVLEPDGRVVVDGRDWTDRVREEDVTAAVPLVATLPLVRHGLVAHQRRFAERAGRVVAEGRDIGTVVFPDAQVKVFLDGDASERARRRLLQNDPEARADGPEGARVRAEIDARDRTDRGREVAPLVQAADAWRLDTTRMTLDEVLLAVLSHVRSRIPVADPPHPGA